LDDLSGYDSVSRCIRLTTNLEVTKDSQDRTVGFLGRAHPLVRWALERVRNLSYGSSAQPGLDPRVSAAKADVKQPTLLYTYLARISSKVGRELEQVIAVKNFSVYGSGSLGCRRTMVTISGSGKSCRDDQCLEELFCRMGG